MRLRAKVRPVGLDTQKPSDGGRADARRQMVNEEDEAKFRCEIEPIAGAPVRVRSRARGFRWPGWMLEIRSSPRPLVRISYVSYDLSTFLLSNTFATWGPTGLPRE